MFGFQTHPERLLDHVIGYLGLPNDAALAYTLLVGPPAISKVRHRKMEVSSELLIRMHLATSISIRDLRRVAGDLRPHTGPSASIPS